MCGGKVLFFFVFSYGGFFLLLLMMIGIWTAERGGAFRWKLLLYLDDRTDL